MKRKQPHSESLRKKAVVLSVDEIILALFGQDTGKKHDDYVAAEEYSEWHKRINKCNADISSGRLQAYYADEGLAKKFAELFEKPDENELNDFLIV